MRISKALGLLLYSPHPPAHYTRPCAVLGRVGIGAEMDRPEVRPQWNLFWLSEPKLDSFLGNNVTWQTAPNIDAELLAACYEAVRQPVDGALLGELLVFMPPPDFVKYLRGRRYDHLAPFKLRGEAWLKTMEERAKTFRGTVAKDGKVTYINFAPKQLDEKEQTKPKRSARIMTLALRKI